jgi:hypothetical protein
MGARSGNSHRARKRTPGVSTLALGRSSLYDELARAIAMLRHPTRQKPRSLGGTIVAKL